MIRAGFLGLCALCVAAPLSAVGLSPLVKSGLTDGPAKAFRLTVINPYRDAREFRLYVESAAEVGSDENIQIRPGKLRIAGQKQRRVLVILTDLKPGENRSVRVCASLAEQQGIINARVCSDFSARRVVPRSFKPGSSN